MSDQEPKSAARGRQNLVWFVMLGCGIGFLFDQALLGALAGFGAWAARRGAGEGKET